MEGRIVVLLKGYPRLSETFIAQELRGLELAGRNLVLVSMRRPTDTRRHPVHDEIRAPVHYLPEYLHEAPLRVLRAALAGLLRPGFWPAAALLARDFRRDRTRNRLRRFGQALVLANEWPAGGGWLHVHFIHTPASVARYAAVLFGVPWSCSAHAKDIWTSPDWDIAEKLAAARGVVTCTRAGFDQLRSLAADPARVHLSYHGLDLNRFPHFSGRRAGGDGSDPQRPVTILSVGRAVEKKGYDVLLDALARLPSDLHWRFVHIGGGDLLEPLKEQAGRLGLADRIEWLGAMTQTDVLDAYRRADLFVLPCRVAGDGDRDGLPNVLVEASSQGLPCLSTTVSGVPELIEDGVDGLLVAPEAPDALAAALAHAISDPALRERLGAAADTKVRAAFDHQTSIRQLDVLFSRDWETAP